MLSPLLTEAESLHFPFAEGPGIWPRVYVLHPLSRLLSPLRTFLYFINHISFQASTLSIFPVLVKNLFKYPFCALCFEGGFVVS